MVLVFSVVLSLCGSCVFCGSVVLVFSVVLLLCGSCAFCGSSVLVNWHYLASSWMSEDNFFSSSPSVVLWCLCICSLVVPVLSMVLCSL